jgi:hypothetical protein
MHACLLLLPGLLIVRVPIEFGSDGRQALPRLVWLAEGAGSGARPGGGGNEATRATATRAQRPGQETLTTPAASLVDFDAHQATANVHRAQEVMVPVHASAAGLRDLPGAFLPVAVDLLSRGPGSGPGSDGGKGSGSTTVVEVRHSPATV